MEAIILILLSGFALVGVVYTILYLISSYKSRFPDNGIKLILYLPHNSGSKLEGLVRQIYYEEIPEKFMTDGKVYLMISPQDIEAMEILEKLKKMYPIEVLPEQVSYCMIQREKYAND
ncbi:MAG: hypothetical protein GX227_10785 [Clostridiaceae bacterium]|jgi:hypothetical protein|nr:hypothetical protein [Clostridiaceae bacterium]